MSTSYFVYEGDTNWYDVNSLLADSLAAILGITSALELLRGVIHGVFPYESHTKISGMYDALNMSQRELDISAVFTGKWGVASLVLFFAYLQPFFFADNLTQLAEQALYLMSFTFIVKSVDFMNGRNKWIYPMNKFDEDGWTPPGAHMHTF